MQASRLDNRSGDARVFGRESEKRFRHAVRLKRFGGVSGVVSEPGPGLTHDSADAVEVVLLPACRPGPSSWHPPVLPV